MAKVSEVTPSGDSTAGNGAGRVCVFHLFDQIKNSLDRISKGPDSSTSTSLDKRQFQTLIPFPWLLILITFRKDL